MSSWKNNSPLLLIQVTIPLKTGFGKAVEISKSFHDRIFFDDDSTNAGRMGSSRLVLASISDSVIAFVVTDFSA